MARLTGPLDGQGNELQDVLYEQVAALPGPWVATWAGRPVFVTTAGADYGPWVGDGRIGAFVRVNQPIVLGTAGAGGTTAGRALVRGAGATLVERAAATENLIGIALTTNLVTEIASYLASGVAVVAWVAGEEPTVDGQTVYLNNAAPYYDWTIIQPVGGVIIKGTAIGIGVNALVQFYPVAAEPIESMYLPIEWATDGAVAPAAAAVETSGLGSVTCRKFDGAVAEDVVFAVEIPENWVTVAGLRFAVCGWITEAVLPGAGERVNFTLQGTGIADDDSLNIAFNPGAGYIQDSLSANMNGYAQFDRFKTALSALMLVDNGGVGRKVMLNLIRTPGVGGDNYAQDVGIDGIMVYPVW